MNPTEMCVFCKIIKGEAPSYKVYEDDEFFGFLDIYPRTKGHSLLIPKKHYQWVYDIPNFDEYWMAVLKLTKAIKIALSPFFITYVTHGLEIAHAHVHILPRTHEDTSFVPDVKQISKEDMKKIADTILQAVETL
ncbi:HIT family protein [Candidatus Roizmanbacteria bacterium]|nr:HIT family protein [Candidatus Roizmanbacteria bacterium]